MSNDDEHLFSAGYTGADIHVSLGFSNDMDGTLESLEQDDAGLSGLVRSILYTILQRECNPHIKTSTIMISVSCRTSTRAVLRRMIC
jgi:hypothetical protein